MKNHNEISLGGIVLLLALITPCVRVFAFHSMPWRYALFPALVWAVSVVVGVVRGRFTPRTQQTTGATAPKEEINGNI